MEPLEHAEDLLVVTRGNPDAVVAHKEFIRLWPPLSPPRRGGGRLPTEFNPLVGRSVEFDRVADEILENLPQKDRFNLHSGPVIRHHNLHVRRQTKNGEQFSQKRADVNRLDGDAPPMTRGIINA